MIKNSTSFPTHNKTKAQEIKKMGKDVGQIHNFHKPSDKGWIYCCSNFAKEIVALTEVPQGSSYQVPKLTEVG